MTTAGAQLQELAAQSPHVDVLRYEHKNLKFTLQHVNGHADSLAIGFLDCGLEPGDIVLSWLPDHFAEQVRVFHMLASIGFSLAWITTMSHYAGCGNCQRKRE